MVVGRLPPNGWTVNDYTTVSWVLYSTILMNCGGYDPIPEKEARRQLCYVAASMTLNTAAHISRLVGLCAAHIYMSHSVRIAAKR